MTKQQKKWAAQHDWFRHETETGCMCWQEETRSTREFTNFREMREWAGY